MKKLLLLLSVLSCVGGVWAMEGERKKATVHYLEVFGERIQVKPQTLELSRILKDIVGKTWVEKPQKLEVEQEIRSVIDLDMYLKGCKKFMHPDALVAAVRFFVAYAQGGRQAQGFSDEELLHVIVVADVLVATKREEEHFTPRKDILAELLQALSLRIKKMLKSKEWVQDFLDGKGLLREMMERLPTSVQDEVIRRQVGLSELFMDPVVLRGHTGPVTSLIELSDGRLASGSGDGTIMIWKKGLDGKFAQAQELHGHKDRVLLLIELSDGRLASVFFDKTIIIWKKGPDRKFMQEQVLRGHNRSVLSLLELQDGRLALCSRDKAIILIWKKRPDGKFTQEQVLRGHTDRVRSLIGLGDGRLASGSEDETIRIWKKGLDGKFVQEQMLRGHESWVCSLIELSDGWLASGSADGIIMIWKKGPDGTFAKEHLLNGHTGNVFSLIELSDGRLASGSEDKTIIIWKKGPDGKFVQEQKLRGHTNRVYSVIELKDGRLASGSADDTIMMWKKGPDGKFVQEQKLRGQTNSVFSVVELQDGRLASGSEDKTIMLWDIAPKSCAQRVVMKVLASGPELFEHKQSFFAKMKTYFVKTTTQEELWYKKVFEDELLLNAFISLPEASLHQIIELKGSKVVRIALEKLLDGIREDMEEEGYIEQRNIELAKRFEVVLRLLKSLNLSEKDWALDPLVGYYKEAQAYAVREEAKKNEKNEKVEKKEKPLLKEEVIEIEEKKSEKK